MDLSQRRFLRAGRATDPDNAESSASESDEEPQESVNGLEIVTPRRSTRDTHSTELVSHRDHGVIQSRNLVYEDISNKLLPPAESESMIKRLEKHVDEPLRRTYIGGIRIAEVSETAVVPRVGLTFMPGADKPQVTRIEQMNMTGREPDQRDANWRVNTAGSLLMHFDVSADLAVVQSDKTSSVVAHTKSRLQKREILFPANISQKKIHRFLRNREDAVTMDSEYIKIVNDLRTEQCDLEATLVEVDFGSLMNLMVNYKHLISRGGPDMTFDETRNLLETMIEDARRLCVRSPILFRMSTRSHIIKSKETRYGIDNVDMFRTLTTSKGIREIISLSASYYNSLDPTGTKDTTQKFIKPRFLQMIVLLLSLLNDDDLGEIKDFLETTYQLKADRPHLELLFLKVIPLMSINSKVFLKSMVPAFEGFPLNRDDESTHRHIWNVFIQRILRQGYLLPGRVTDLGCAKLSWAVKWPEDGFKSTLIFNNLQYAGCRLRTMNDIPPIELHPESSLNEVTVVMTNHDKYKVGSTDLDMITCLTPGTYPVQEAAPNGRHYDLEIQEYPINSTLYDAIRRTNTIIQKLNVFLAGPRRQGMALLWRKPNDLGFLPEFKGSGRLTKNTAILQQTLLAVAYKVEGRKIAKSDAVRNMSKDIRDLRDLLTIIERRWGTIDGKPFSLFSDEKRKLKHALETVKDQIAVAEDHRKNLGNSPDLSDEPILKVLYPHGVDLKAEVVWNDYTAWYQQAEGLFYIDAKQSIVTKVTWLTEEMIEVSLYNHPVNYFVTPLEPVEEGDRGDEIQVNDIAILVGQYLIIAEDLNDGCPGLIMTNYLRVTSAEELYRSKRGINRLPATSLTTKCIFR